MTAPPEEPGPQDAGGTTAVEEAGEAPAQVQGRGSGIPGRWLSTPLRQGVALAVVLLVGVGVYFAGAAIGRRPAGHPPGRPSSSASPSRSTIRLAGGAQFTLQPGWRVETESGNHAAVLLQHSDPSALVSVTTTAGNINDPVAALRADVPRVLGPDASALRSVHTFATNRSMFDQAAQAGFNFLSSSGKVLTTNGEAVELIDTESGYRALFVFIPPNLAALKDLTHGVSEMILSLAQG